MASSTANVVSMAPEKPSTAPVSFSGGAQSSVQPEAASSERALPRMVAYLKTAAHPVTCFFHAIFKVAVLVTYINGRYIAGAYVTTFIFSTIFSALDFWTVKNITGRKLVGLRWWNHVRDDGSSEWIFESNPDENSVNQTDRTIFWGLVYTWPGLWALILLLNVVNFNFNWVLLIALILTFAFSNLAGYWKCSKDAKKRAKEWVEQQGMRMVMQGMGMGV